jgi:predicted signal transduction protein with EAL and GGDEF domain
MNLKLKAAALTAGVLGAGALVGFILSNIPTWVAIIILIAFVSYFVYNLTLSCLKYDKSMEEINKKYQK